MYRHIVFLKSQIAKCGGLEKYTLRLMKHFYSRGQKVTLLTTDYIPGKLRNQIDEHSVEIVNLGNKAPLSLWHLLRFDASVRRYLDMHHKLLVFGMDRNFCTQHLYRAGNGVHAAYLDRRSEQASWVKRSSFAVNPLHQLILKMEKNTFENKELRCLFTNSHMVKDEILHYYSVDPKKIAVVHNGVEWHELQTPFDEGLKQRRQLITQLGLNPDCYQFLFVGNDYERKGLKLLLQALSRLVEKEFQLSVAGKEKHPEHYYKLVEALGLKDKVRFFGPTKEVKTLYSAADSLVIASMYDPFANVTVEALAMGLFVISSTANGGSEILTTQDRGVTFSNLKEPDELCACLQEAMKCPKNTVRAQTIRNSVEEFDFSKQLEKIAKASIGS